MPAKTTTTKKTTSKKTVAKPVASKKTVAPKKQAATQKPMEKHTECLCGHQCSCHHGHCNKAHCKFGKFVKKLVIFFVIFALGFATAKSCCFNKHGKMFKPQFENGCLVIKCPKMMQMAPMMDINKDGCINREEFRNARKFLKGKKHHMRAEIKDTEKVEM